MPKYEVRLENHPEYKSETVEAKNPAEAARFAADANPDFWIQDVKEIEGIG